MIPDWWDNTFNKPVIALCILGLTFMCISLHFFGIKEASFSFSAAISLMLLGAGSGAIRTGNRNTAALAFMSAMLIVIAAVGLTDASHYQSLNVKDALMALVSPISGFLTMGIMDSD